MFTIHTSFTQVHKPLFRLTADPPTRARGVKLVDKQGDLQRAVFCGPHGPVAITSSHLKSHAAKINNCEMEIITAPLRLSNGASRGIRTVRPPVVTR